MNYMAKLARLSQADKKKAAEKARLKERARVNAYGKKAQKTDSSERAKTSATPRTKLKYSPGIDVMGHGMQNLVDVVGGRKSTPQQLKRYK